MDHSITFEHKVTLNSRSYAIFLSAAENALKTHEKLETCSELSYKNHGHDAVNRPDLDYIFFDREQLRMICFDYTFSALENFLEHIGFILFSNWDSKGKQGHYSDKKTKLLKFNEMVHKQYQHLASDPKSKWKGIIEPIDFRAYNTKRNPIKHTHSGKHDTKIHSYQSNDAAKDQNAYDKLVNETVLGLTKDNCVNFVREVNELITSVCSFLKKHESILSLSQETKSEETIDLRKKLLGTLLVAPLTYPLWTETIDAKTEPQTATPQPTTIA